MAEFSLHKIKKDTIDYMYADTEDGRHFRDTVTAYAATAMTFPLTGLIALGYGLYKNDFSLAENYFRSSALDIAYAVALQVAGSSAITRVIQQQTEHDAPEPTRQEIKDDFKKRGRKSLFFATALSLVAGGATLLKTDNPSPKTDKLPPALQFTLPVPAQEQKHTPKLQELVN